MRRARVVRMNIVNMGIIERYGAFFFASFLDVFDSFWCGYLLFFVGFRR